MRTLLTFPRYAEARNPIAALDLAAYLRSTGMEVDCYYTDSLPVERNYDLVGFSVLFGAYEDIAEEARLIRKTYGCPVVIGGKWTRTLEACQRDQLEESGILVSELSGEEYFTGKEPLSLESYASWNERDFISMNFAGREIMSSRGCPFSCHFCHNTERKVRFFSAERTADNVQILLNRGIDKVFFVDDIFVARPRHAAAVFDELDRRGIDLRTRSYFFVHVKYITEEVIELIRRTRPDHVQIGIESGDDRMLERMGKGFTSNEAHERISLLHAETQVDIAAMFIAGFPEETVESLENSLSFARKIRPYISRNIHCSYYQPVPGTVGHRRALERAPLSSDLTNQQIAYIDPNVTASMLTKYCNEIMNS